MGQVFAKAGELVTKIISRVRSKCGKSRSRPKRSDLKDVSSKPASTLEPEDVREQVITILDAHIVTIPEESEDKSNIIHHIGPEVRFNLSNGVAGPSNWGNVRSKPKKRDKWIKHYCSSHRILLVGEGDFSFSACLAKSFGSATKMVATSLDSENFTEKLVRLFMKNAKEILEEDGEIHITHKSYGFYLERNLEKLARQSGLVLLEDVEFYLRDYPGYSTKYGCGGDNHFNCCRSRTYKFGLK